MSIEGPTVGRGLAIGFWTLFAISIIVHFWIGGVVVDMKIEGTHHLIMLREQRDEWVNVSAFAFWTHLTGKFAMQFFCVLAILWALSRLLLHGRFGESD